MGKLKQNLERPLSARPCPDCGAIEVLTTLANQEFVYGVGSQAVKLVATVPLRHCEACGMVFTDREAEEIRHEVVCRHLGVLTPRQVHDLRELYGYSQASFAELTKLGAATISRWERGALIQNHAYDNYLYLLGFSDNHYRLQNRAKHSDNVASKRQQPRFKALQTTEHLLQRQRDFRLTPAA